MCAKHQSPAKRVRNIKRLLSFLLAKFKQQTSVPLIQHSEEKTKSSSKYEKQYCEQNCCVHPQPDAKPFTMNDFLSLSRSMIQDKDSERRRMEEIKKEREEDLRNLELLLEFHPT